MTALFFGADLARLLAMLLARMLAVSALLVLAFALPTHAGGGSAGSPRVGNTKNARQPSAVAKRSRIGTNRAARGSLSRHLDKFARVHRFAERLDALRATVDTTLRNPTTSRETAVAAIIRLMDTGYLRVGSSEYARPNQPNKEPSYGASSLLKKHVRITGSRVTLEFTGKSGVAWKKTINDRALATAIEKFLALPGDRLFQVPTTTGRLIPVTEHAVRQALKPYGALPKDFRTLHANRLFREKLAALPVAKTARERQVNTKKAIQFAAKQLNHEAATSEASYLEPRVVQAYRERGIIPIRGPPP